MFSVDIIEHSGNQDKVNGSTPPPYWSRCMPGQASEGTKVRACLSEGWEGLLDSLRQVWGSRCIERTVGLMCLFVV